MEQQAHRARTWPVPGQFFAFWVIATIPVLTVAACGSDENATGTPLPATAVLSRAQDMTSQLTSYDFDGEITASTTEPQAPDWMPDVAGDERSGSGKVVGEWEEPSDWMASIEGFNLGTGLLDEAGAASNGTKTVFREDPESPWREIEGLPIPAPTPETWEFVLGLDGITMQRREGMAINDEPVYALSATRETDAANIAPIFGDLPGLTGPVTEAYDIFIGTEDFQVRRLTASTGDGRSNLTVTWDFDNHNRAGDVDLPDEVTEE
jgi:hypothetical protein